MGKGQSSQVWSLQNCCKDCGLWRWLRPKMHIDTSLLFLWSCTWIRKILYRSRPKIYIQWHSCYIILLLRSWVMWLWMQMLRERKDQLGKHPLPEDCGRRIWQTNRLIHREGTCSVSSISKCLRRLISSKRTYLTIHSQYIAFYFIKIKATWFLKGSARWNL